MSDLKIAVAGAGGRMGGAIVRAVVAADGVELASVFERAGATNIGKDPGPIAGVEPTGLAITEDVEAALGTVDAVIDFTVPAASVELASRAAKRGLVHVIGTTGCSPDDDAAIAAAAEKGARIVKSGNMSLGVNLLAGLVRKAAAALDESFDIEVLEMHHRMKVDAPSGTALLLGEAAAAGRGIDLAENAVRVRDGHTGAREAGTIGFAALRGGTVVGEHSVILAGPQERIELSHKAEDRAIFANGALKAAIWAAGQPAGLYSMTDVLGLGD